MNLNDLKEQLGDNFQAFIKETTECYQAGQIETIRGISFEVIRHERDNEYMEHVIKIENSYFRILGSYDSWSGTYWDYAEVIQVKPVEVTTTEYQKI